MKYLCSKLCDEFTRFIEKDTNFSTKHNGLHVNLLDVTNFGHKCLDYDKD